MASHSLQAMHLLHHSSNENNNNNNNNNSNNNKAINKRPRRRPPNTKELLDKPIERLLLPRTAPRRWDSDAARVRHGSAD